MYVEYCKGIKDRGNIVGYGEIQPVKRDFESYISLFPFDASIKDYVLQNGSISGFKGKHYLPYILFDIDIDGDLDGAKQSTIQLINELGKKGIKSDELYIFFSGNKGFHVALTDKIYGKIEPSETIAEQVKNWVIINFGHIPGIDSVIYEPHRLIRISNSLHPKSGLYKIPLTYSELCSDDILELAKDSRTINHIKGSEIRFNDVVRNEVLTPVHIESKEEEINLDKGFFTPASKGNRNQKYFEQACTLYKNTQLTTRSIYEIIHSINSASNNPIEQTELELLLKSASKYRKGIQEISFNTFGELVPEWLDYNKKENDPMRFGLQMLDDEFKGKLRGQLGLIVGYGGSKKSIIAQNICYNNLPHHRALYSNMEMGASKLMDRFIDMLIDNTEHNASFDLQLLLKRDEEQTRQILTNEIAPIYSDKLLFCQNSSMTPDDYDKLLTKIKDEVGTVDMLIVDGLSMMGGSGTENEVYTKNSKELKDLAKKHNIFIPLIAHASRGEKPDTRSLIRSIRGSEKIMDNCDFVITMSLVKHNDGWSNEYGVYNMWNKRGSGNTIEKVYRFDRKRLLMEDYEGDNSDILGNNDLSF